MLRRPLLILLLVLVTVSFRALSLLPVQSGIAVAQNVCPLAEIDGQVGGTVRAILAEDRYIYAVAAHRLLVLDIADPTRPEVVGRTPPELLLPSHPGWTLDLLAYHDGYLFVRADYCRGGDPPSETALVAYDVTDPREPTFVGRMAKSDALLNYVDLRYSIGVFEGTLFAAGYEAVRAIDITDPTAMTRLDSMEWINSAEFLDMAVIGGFLYAQDPNAIRGVPKQSGIRVFDINDPQAIEEEAVVAAPGFQWKAIEAVGDLLVGYGGEEGLHVLDATDPLSPTQIGGLLMDLREIPDGRDRITWADLEADGSHLYLTRPGDTHTDVAIVDITDPISPSLVAAVQPLGEPWDIEASTRRLYVANGFENRLYHDEYRGIEVYDVSAPERPQRVGGTSGLWPAFDVAVSGSVAYVAAGAAGLRVVDVADPHQPAELGYLDTIGQINDVVVSNGFAYLACGLGDNPGLAVVDVSDPSAPILAATLKLPGGQDTAVSLVVKGGTAYEVTDEGWLHALDVGDPRRPTLTSSHELMPSGPIGDIDLRALALDVEGDVLYIVLDDPSAHGWLTLWSIAAPNGPQEISRLKLDHGQPFGAETSVPMDIAVAAFRAYVPVAEYLLSVDVFDPALPAVADVTRMPIGPSHIATCLSAAGDRLYACMRGGYAVFDIEGSSPQAVVTHWLIGGPWHAQRHNGLALIDDGHVAIAHYGNGLIIVRPEEPALPTATASPSPSPAFTPTTRPTTASHTATPIRTDTATLTPAATPTSTTVPTQPATVQASATSVPAVPPTKTPTPTAIPSPYASPTPVPAPVFLPLLLSESCPPKDLFSDIVLVIDASTSMHDLASGRRPKIDLAVESARAFLQGLRLRPGEDRAAIVAFNEQAETLVHLTSSRERLDAGLSRIRIAEYSRVDLGVERAMVELITRGRYGHVLAMVVLSDGMVNPVSGDEAIAAARRAQLEGITMYVVGFGPSLDERVLRQMASGVERYFPAPDPLLIRSIYQDLTKRVPCPPEAYWGRR